MKILTEESYDQLSQEFDIYAAESGADRELDFDYEMQFESFIIDALGTDMYELEDTTPLQIPKGERYETV